MTEKRYTTMWKPETTFSRFWIVRENWERKLNANDVVDLLNEQHEQIEDLKDVNIRCCNEYSYFHKRMMQVEKENEQLKQELIEFKKWETHVGDVKREDLDKLFKMSIYEIAEAFAYYEKRIKELEE